MEYPSSREKTDANAVHSIMSVTTAPTPGPQMRAMKSEAMKRDFSTSCHGIAPRIAMFIVRYRAATPAIESRIARGMTRPGLRISPPR